jgi:hypothetical protein
MNSKKQLKKATPHRNTAKPKEPKVVQLDEWLNFNTYEKGILTTLSIERLARELVEWARTNPEAIKINQFLEERGIHIRSWNRWCTKYEVLRDARDHAKMILGNRREHGVMTRKYEPTSTNFMMLNYDDDWVDTMKLKTGLTNKDGDSGGGPQIVVIEKYPDSPMVPTRVIDEG